MVGRILLLPALALVACGAGNAGVPTGAAERRSAGVPSLLPARYLVAESSWIERTEDGLERVIVNGRRMELSGPSMVNLGPAGPLVDRGARAPAWLGTRYVFWKGKLLYMADTFFGPLRRVAELPGEPRGSFDWTTGTGLLFDNGALLVPASGGPLVGLGVPLVVHAVAADARRALVTTAFGHALLTLDGGATYRDESVELGGAVGLVVRGEDIVAVLPGGRERRVGSAGAIADARPGLGRGQRPEADPGRFPGGDDLYALDVAVRAGVPLPGGDVLVAAGGFVGRIDSSTLRTASVTALDPWLQQADCVPFQAADGPLLACVSAERAAIVDIYGAPRLERSFDLDGAADLDRFVGADGAAVGFLGPCDGAKVARVDAEIIGPEGPYNASPMRSAVFCVRARRDEWVEHTVEPADATDLIAWIPRVGGGAVAIVARPGALLQDRERVSVRGSLRVVRVARSEPPLALHYYGYGSSPTLERSLQVLADDTIEGWLGGVTNAAGMLSVTIDAAGRVRVWPMPPRVTQLSSAGRFALAQTDDGWLWETVDSGRRWSRVEPPPGSFLSGRLSGCSPVGCRIGPYLRVGWSLPEGPPVSFDDALREAPEPMTYARPRPPAPLSRLTCAFAGAPEGKRISESVRFGYSATPLPHGSSSPVRVGTLGWALVPARHKGILASGDVEVGWLHPLDTSAELRRAVIAAERIGLSPGAPHVYEVGLGWLLTPDGGLSTFPVGERCLASLTEVAGISRAIGGCAPGSTVGVDIGGRLLMVRADGDTLSVSTIDAPARQPPRTARLGAAAPLRELHRVEVGAALRGFTLGVGVRAGSPVAVMLDLRGDATLAPIDRERGTLGAEEALRPLPEARLGSDRACAPRPGEATVVLPFRSTFGLAGRSLPGLTPTPGPGVAVLRWSRERACLDALELPVSDERFEDGAGLYDRHGTVRKLVARFEGRGGRGGVLVEIASGSEMRQRVVCSGLTKD